jgi:hypothetical protein
VELVFLTRFWRPEESGETSLLRLFLFGNVRRMQTPRHQLTTSRQQTEMKTAEEYGSDCGSDLTDF